MVQSVDGKTLAAMLVHASASLNAEKQKINELNVFPVPDGDTGTNMGLTLGTAAAELRQKAPTTAAQASALWRLGHAPGGPGQLRGDSLPDLPGILPGDEGQGHHGRH